MSAEFDRHEKALELSLGQCAQAADAFRGVNTEAFLALRYAAEAIAHAVRVMRHIADAERPQERYVVVYRNLPEHKGLDEFLLPDEGNTVRATTVLLEEAMLFTSRAAALATARKRPALAGHSLATVAEVVERETRPVVMRLEVGREVGRSS